MILRRPTTYLFTLVTFVFLSGCFEVPNFPNTPTITFENVEFKEGVTLFDSLIISINYQDGNGDLGLDDRFTDGAYVEGSYYSFDGENPINLKDIGRAIDIPDFEGSVVPPYERPYSCINWIETPTINGNEIQDTLFYVPNVNHFNIFVKFLYRDKNASEDTPFEEFDWIGSEELPTCGSPIDARFPVLKDLSESNAPIEGILRYGYVTSGLIPLFNDRELKLEVQIQDRELQRSNTVTITGNKDADPNATGFLLEEIQVN